VTWQEHPSATHYLLQRSTTENPNQLSINLMTPRANYRDQELAPQQSSSYRLDALEF